jgi:hypothetical protein
VPAGAAAVSAAGGKPPLGLKLKGGLSSSKRKREELAAATARQESAAAAAIQKEMPFKSAPRDKGPSSAAHKPVLPFGRFEVFGSEELLTYLSGQEERVRARTRQCQDVVSFATELQVRFPLRQQSPVRCLLWNIHVMPMYYHTFSVVPIA